MNLSEAFVKNHAMYDYEGQIYWVRNKNKVSLDLNIRLVHGLNKIAKEYPFPYSACHRSYPFG